MQPEPDMPQDETHDPVTPVTPPTDLAEHGTLLRLLDNCVTAMRLLDRRMLDLEAKASQALEESNGARTETRADVSALRTRTKLTDSNLEQIGARLAALEVGSLESAIKYTCEINAAQSMTEAWQAKAESAVSRLADVETRLGDVETGLERRLRETETKLADARDDTTRMEARATASEALAGALQARLHEAVSAVSDQRARIACLQAKLAAAAQVSRYTEESVSLAQGLDRHAVPAIIDLLAVSDERRVAVA